MYRYAVHEGMAQRHGEVNLIGVQVLASGTCPRGQVQQANRSLPACTAVVSVERSSQHADLMTKRGQFYT